MYHPLGCYLFIAAANAAQTNLLLLYSNIHQLLHEHLILQSIRNALSAHSTQYLSIQSPSKKRIAGKTSR